MNRIRIIFALIILLAITGCSGVVPEIETKPRPAMPKAAVASPDTIPALLQVAGWLAQYGKGVVELSESGSWESSYPTEGSHVDYFIWQIEIQTEAIDYVDPEGLVASLRILVPAASQDSVRVRTRVVDDNHIAGGWSPWGHFMEETKGMENE